MVPFGLHKTFLRHQKEVRKQKIYVIFPAYYLGSGRQWLRLELQQRYIKTESEI